MPTAGGESAPAEAPAGPTTVSVDLKNSCKDTVKVFFGDKPKFGSGTYSSMSSNSRTGKTFQPGDMVWIVDNSQNGVASVTVAAGMKEIEITSSCTSLSSR